jgi:hypothetical protein
MSWALLASLAAAQETVQLDADLWRPAPDTDHGWTLEPARAPRAQVLAAHLQHVHEPLVYLREDGAETAIVRDATTAHLTAAWGLERFGVGLEAPVILWSSSDLDGLRGSHLGDPALSLRAWLVDAEERGVGLSATGRLQAPLGAASQSLGEPGWTWELGLAGQGELGPVRALGNLAYLGRAGTELPHASVDDVLRAGLGVAWGQDRGLSGEVVTHAALRSLAAAPFSRPAELMLGGWVTDAQGRRLRLGGSTGLNAGIGAPRFRVVVGVELPTVRDW